MWLLESQDAFDGRQMWLRPGKTYLFGRTASEPGQLAISHSTISRKHLTITVDNVEQGHAHRLNSRSRLVVEDLATKIGTVVNGSKIRGSKYVANGQDLEVIMGKCPSKFKITWFPVVVTFSFTNKELQTDPLSALRQRFEQLDIKLLTDYHIEHTTHVVSRKRNTAKGLQALINAKYLVSETFLDAVTQAAEMGENNEPGALEQDFGQSWPDAAKHLPPRGGEPVQHPDLIYAPDPGRKEVFDGYTFIFYDNTQYANLMAPITNGGGKAMLRVVVPREIEVDDFVRYVKGVAGEKGLGCFEDGSEGKGVVLVRYLPAKGDQVNWYAEFITTVSLRLDHRPIEQNEFLEAILTKDASKLRRPLEVEPDPGDQDVAMNGSSSAAAANDNRGPAEPPIQHLPQTRLNRARRPVKRRFAGFDDEADGDMDETQPLPNARVPLPDLVQEEDGGLFVSQGPDAPALQTDLTTVDDLSRKRLALSEDDLMDGMAPAAARFKRQRLERGDHFASPSPESEMQSEPVPAKSKKKVDLLAMAARNREEEEARARAEREDLANLPDGIDLAEIRRLNIVEEVNVRMPDRAARTREQDVADGRWNPKWNGIKNFKKFRRRGENKGRQPVRTIVALQEVKTKEFGIGDNYWLDDGSVGRKQASTALLSGSNTQASPTSTSDTLSRKRASRVIVSASEQDDDIDDNDVVVVRATASGKRSDDASGTRYTEVSATPSLFSSTAATAPGRSRREKRPAASDLLSNSKPKRARTALQADATPVSDESEDELKFRFGRRR